MQEKKTGVAANSLIWFGAGISMAEILTGTLFAPLGMAKGMAAVILGHVIGGILMLLCGLIGAYSRKSAMEAAKISFGKQGGKVFSALNILQLVGWTGVMLISGASAATAAAGGRDWIWCLVIGALIALWVILGAKNLSRVNAVAIGALFITTCALSGAVFKGTASLISGNITFGAAVELAAAMPLSWLPLISDYTRSAKRPVAVTAASTLAYSAASIWMYAIGLGAAIFAGEGDIVLIMAKAGLGIAALIIVVFSTVTTAFLDVYSAGVSALSISEKLREKPFALAVCVLGVLLALFAPMARFEDFLYLIGSVFAPMAAIQIADFFILKRDVSEKSADVRNFLIWGVGFALYRMVMHLSTPLGYTLPVMLLTALICVAVHSVANLKKM